MASIYLGSARVNHPRFHGAAPSPAWQLAQRAIRFARTPSLDAGSQVRFYCVGHATAWTRCWFRLDAAAGASACAGASHRSATPGRQLGVMAGPPRRAHVAGHRRYAVALRGSDSATTASNVLPRSDRRQIPARRRLDARHSAALFIAAPPVPVTVKQRDERGEDTGEKKVFFRTVPVFDTLSRDRWEEHRGSRAAGCLLAG
jgi:hypothetical protein